MPIEKFAAAITPMPACAAISRTSASSACQPVVPMTTAMPRRGELLHVPEHRRAVREIHRDVDVPEVRRRDRVGTGAARHDAGDLAAVRRRQRLDQPPHPAVPDEQQPSSLSTQPASPRQARGSLEARAPGAT